MTYFPNQNQSLTKGFSFYMIIILLGLPIWKFSLFNYNNNQITTELIESVEFDKKDATEKKDTSDKQKLCSNIQHSTEKNEIKQVIIINTIKYKHIIGDVITPPPESIQHLT